jgi:hypothetical protein
LKFAITTCRLPVLIFVLIIACTINLQAQNSTQSPYSRFGIGILNSTAFATNLAMGGTDIGLSQAGHINYGNPASYSSLWFTTYEGAMEFKQYEYKTDITTHHSNTASVSYFEFAFPVKPAKWSLGFGLMPYSKVGYLVNTTTKNSFDDLVYGRYEGSGGLNSFHIVNGFKISKKISFGFNAEYLFGIINNDRRVSFPSIYYYGTEISSSTSVSWFHFTGGLQAAFDSIQVAKSDSIIMLEKKIGILESSLKNYISNNIGNTSPETYEKKNELTREIAEAKLMKENVVRKKVKSDWRLVFGLIASPQMDLHATNTSLINSFKSKYLGSSAEVSVIRDTIEYKKGDKSYVRLPLSLGAGFSLQKSNKLLFCGDFRFQQWSKFSFLGAPDSLVDSWKVSGGIQYIPNDRAIKSYLQTVHYRVGFHYDHGYLKLNGTNITDIGASIGFGLPIRKAGTLLNFTLEGGNQGTTKNNLLLEKYFRIMIGFTINDRWFIKTKYE